MRERISIVSMASISALGRDEKQIWQQYKSGNSLIRKINFEKFSALVSGLSPDLWEEINELKTTKNYKDLDPSVLMAIYCSRMAYDKVNWGDKEFGVNIGSSRGATRLFEKYHEEFLRSDKGRVNTLSSPTTTLGNISSWVGHDLHSQGPVISLCPRSTAR